jgi:hypothetical protein
MIQYSSLNAPRSNVAQDTRRAGHLIWPVLGILALATAAVVAYVLLVPGRIVESAVTPSAVDVRGEAIVPLSQTTAPTSSSNTLAAGSEANRNGSSTAGPAQTQPAIQPGPETGASGATNLVVAGRALSSKDGHLVVGFDVLSSYKYEMPDDPLATNQVAETKDQIPREIRALDKSKIALRGFMLPLKVQSGLVTELLIMRDQTMCCYGAVPKINEWVSVKLTGGGVKPIMDQPIQMFGTLRVGEIRENGYLVGIYHMDGDRMLGPEEL